MGGSPIDAFAWGSIVLGDQLDISSEFDRRLSIGASIACRLRGAVRQQLGKLLWAHPLAPFRCHPAPLLCLNVEHWSVRSFEKGQLLGQVPEGHDVWA